MSENSLPDGVSEAKIARIRNRVLEEEEEQLNYRRPPKIIEPLKTIVEEEIPASDVPEADPES